MKKATTRKNTARKKAVAKSAGESAAKTPTKMAASELDRHAQSKQFFNLLGGGTREIRGIISGKPLAIGYFDDADQFAHAVREANDKGYNVYINLNPFDPQDARFQPSPVRVRKNACTDADIVRRLRILIDGDTERDHPKGGKICSTDAEHEVALAKIQEIKGFLTAEGCPTDAIIDNDSGNGGSLILGTDLPNVEASTELVRRFLQALAQRFGDAAFHVDTSVSNASRITRVPGSKNTKLSVKDRPNRLCYMLAAPETLGVIPIEVLNKIAGTAIAPAEDPADPQIDFAAIPEGDRKEQIEMVVAYLAEVGATPKGFTRNEGKRFICVELPYCLIKGAEHQTPGRAGVLIYDDGRVGYHCFSAQCCEKGWPAVQAGLGLSFAGFCAREFNKTGRQFNDPLRLGQKHLARTAMPDGTPTFAHFWNSTHRFLGGEWQELAPGEEDAWVRDTIQREHDDLAKFVTKQTGVPVKPDPVSGGLVHETVGAIESVCKHVVPKRTQPPFWLAPYDDWLATDVLVFNNGFLNVRKWLDGKEHFIPKTPKLFYSFGAKFDYEEKPKTPAVWHAFLDSLDQKDDWRLQLQQVLGYLLWAGYDLQKFFHFFGPPRAGKTTFTQVASDLGGGACSITLDGFCGSFGLENSIGQRLILVSETEKGPVKFPVSAVVGVIKSITGGGEVEVNRKHIRNISLRLAVKIIMEGNSPFTLPDSSGALMARCIPIRLTKSFLGHENTALLSQLREEYPGILAWCLEGLRNLCAAGQFTLCETTKSELEQMREVASPLQTFVEDCCTVDTTKAVHSTALFRIWGLWSAQEKEGAILDLTEEQFSPELRTVFPAIEKMRLSSKKDATYKDFTIVHTDHDSDADRPYIFTGIAPKPNWCRVAYQC
jgi:P4 family phage/plasmid primase-like protien